MSIVFLFPGQGSQQTGMLHSLPEHPIIKETLDESSRVLVEDVLSLDDELHLGSTVFVQLCLLIAGTACARALQAEGVSPGMAAGHSVGAFAAAVLAETLDYRDALLLVKLRGQLMERAYPHGYGMGVIVGLSKSRLERLIRQVFGSEEPVFITNLNAPTQITVSGKIESLLLFLQTAKSAGARKTALLPVSVPSHCRLLDSVSGQLAEALGGVSMRDPRIPIAGNRKGRLLRTGDEIRTDLASGVSEQVRWHEAVSLLRELGAELWIEMPPGQVLTALVRQEFPDTRAISLSDRGISTARFLAKQYGSNSK